MLIFTPTDQKDILLLEAFPCMQEPPNNCQRTPQTLRARQIAMSTTGSEFQGQPAENMRWESEMYPKRKQQKMWTDAFIQVGLATLRQQSSPLATGP